MSCRHLETRTTHVKTLYDTVPQVHHECGLKTNGSAEGKRLTLIQSQEGHGSIMDIGDSCPHHLSGTHAECSSFAP